MDGQKDTRSRYDDSNKRLEDVCEKRSGNRNRRANDQGHKFLTRTRCVMVHPKPKG